MDVIHHAEKIERLFARVRLVNISYPARNSIDGFVSEFFGQCAAARSENRNQSPTNLLVKISSAFAIRIKPTEQSVEILLPEFLELFRG